MSDLASRRLVLAIFVLSGAAGLVYEIVWSRQLVLVFGNTTQAVSAILTGFFGGMAIGAFVGGRLADRVRSPLRLYGLLELALVVVVLITPVSFGLIHEEYRSIYPGIEGTPLLVLVRLLLAVLALAPATVMMGATFPSLVRHVTANAALSQAFGQLYSANTIGAVIGTVVAGLVLIELFGLSGALLVGAACSGLAGVVAIGLSRRDAIGGLADRVVATAPGPRRSIALALAISFLSGLTSLGYQVTWTRLLASGTGGYTYVFTTVLALFLAGIALGAVIFHMVRPRIADPVRLLVVAQLGVAILAVLGLVLVVASPRPIDPGDPVASVGRLLMSGILVVLPVATILGVSFPTASALLRDELGEAGSESGALLAANTTGAILGSLLIPFVLMPAIGSPAIVVALAVANAGLGIALAVIARPISRGLAATGLAVILGITIAATRPGAVVQPNVALITSLGGRIFASSEDEIASVQAGQKSSTPELWVAGTSMTLLTVDAKLMPVLPLIARPDSTRALVVAFGMGTAFRSALKAGLRTDVVELVPSVPRMFGWYYPDAPTVLANPAGRVVVADGRNHLELSTERFDIIVTDPPPPIESSGASVISSLEYYRAGRAHLRPGGVMMQWVPYGAPENEFKEHIRTFAAVYPHVTVVRGAGGYGVYMLGSDQPITLDPTVARHVLGRPGILEDISSAYDSPASTIDAWLSVIDRQTWLTGAAVGAYAGAGDLITDDHPRPEYFLLRRWLGVGRDG
ncbi:MAG TPA: fused MFS/spermidine synthase [Candidatus Limnocylindrales bacterium]|nr:fused MFS/spermidine synthase [Candidatus Limnocylindrales bacterium]